MHVFNNKKNYKLLTITFLLTSWSASVCQANTNFSNFGQNVSLEDLSKEELASEASEDYKPVTCVKMNRLTTLCNMSSFIATPYNDTFILRQIIGRHFDGEDGIDTINYENFPSYQKMVITLNHKGNGFVKYNAGEYADSLASIENIKLGSGKKNVIKLQDANGRMIDGSKGDNDIVYYTGNVIYDQNNNEVKNIVTGSKDNLIGIEKVVLNSKDGYN